MKKKSQILTDSGSLISNSGISKYIFVSYFFLWTNYNAALALADRHITKCEDICGERFVMSLATVAKTKTRCFHNTYKS